MQFVKRNENEVDVNIAKSISNHFGISYKLAEILVNRGYNSLDLAKSFLKPSWDDFNDPFLFRDMRKAVEVIKQAIANRDKIIVWGDFDCDGSCSTSILALELNR